MRRTKGTSEASVLLAHKEALAGGLHAGALFEPSANPLK
jgi:hypothetical protein